MEGVNNNGDVEVVSQRQKANWKRKENAAEGEKRRARAPEYRESQKLGPAEQGQPTADSGAKGWQAWRALAFLASANLGHLSHVLRFLGVYTL